MCKFYRFLYRFIPLRIIKTLIIEKHFLLCPCCQDDLIIDEYVKDLFKTPRWITEEGSYSRQVIHSIGKESRSLTRFKKSKNHIFSYKLIWASLLFIFIFISVFLGIKVGMKTDKIFYAGGKEVDFSIEYAKFKGKDAKIYIFQTSSKTIIYFSENKNPEE